MDGPGGDGSERKLPPSPPRPPGVVPRNIADLQGGAGASSSRGPPPGVSPSGSGAGGSVEPPGKRQKQTAVVVRKVSQMKRPGWGTKGSTVQLLCNHFHVTFKPQADVSHYDVTIEPPSKSNLNRKVMAALHATYGKEFLKEKRFVYDGEKSLFIVGSLDLKTTEFPVLLEDEPGRGRRGRSSPGGNNSPEEASRARLGREFMVKIQLVATVKMDTIEAVIRGHRDDRAQDALRVLDIMLREHAAKREYSLFKNSYVHHSLGKVENMKDGVDMWRGYHVSFRPTAGGLSLNFDISTALVLKPDKVDKFVADLCKKPVHIFRNEDWLKAKRVLKGVMVVVTYSGRKHKILGFSPKACNQQKFSKRVKDGTGATVDNVEMTVEEYFSQERGMTLKSPSFLALDVGRANKPVYLPMELCEILPGQKYKRSLTTAQRQDQIQFTRQPPVERRRLINEAMEKTHYDQDDLLKEFNVSISRQMKSVTGRVLDPPKLVFGNLAEETPRNGRWNFGTRTMNTPVEIPHWGVVYFRGRQNYNAHKIASDMKLACTQKGMKLGDFELVEEDPRMMNQAPQHRVGRILADMQKLLGKYCKSLVTRERPFILAILPEKSPDLYVPFKRRCECELGILTQCIVPPKKGFDSKYLASVSLKINLKRGGYNSVLFSEATRSLPKISKVPTIVFGLDVSHGSPGDSSSPSVAAAVATVDWPRVSRFTCSIRAQPGKTEMIEGLYESSTSGMVRELLVNFYQFNNKNIKPLQIVIFRDGVSESQFDQVLEKELVAFKMGCASLDKDYNPRITLIVVQKRHHTRFFPVSGVNNVAPGTIVDKDPCHPSSYDFYLCSHTGPIGTSRPTHYHVLYDEIGFTPDELQQLTNSLCYSYTRCTSAVSVVAPAYYAHLAAQHCRAFVKDDYDSGSEASSLATSRVAKAMESLPEIQKLVREHMFYA